MCFRMVPKIAQPLSSRVKHSKTETFLRKRTQRRCITSRRTGTAGTPLCWPQISRRLRRSSTVICNGDAVCFPWCGNFITKYYLQRASVCKGWQTETSTRRTEPDWWSEAKEWQKTHERWDKWRWQKDNGHKDSEKDKHRHACGIISTDINQAKRMSQSAEERRKINIK